MRKTLILAVLSLAACDTAVARIMDPGNDSDRVLLSDAAALLDVEVEWSQTRHGSVYIELRDQPHDGHAGWAAALGCDKLGGWSVRHTTTIAHELGHVWGLVHRQDHDNLMSQGKGGVFLTEHQFRTVSNNVWAQEEMCDDT